ncbi:MAG TPA: hypothetical protein PLE22_04445 [Acidovorax sp.]|nr:hypothetical protein [Acidovorax sp.]
MRRGLSLLLMVVLVLRGLAGTAMAAGTLPPLQPLDAAHTHLQSPQAHHQDISPSATALSGHPHASEQSGHGHDGVHDHAATATAATCDSTPASCAAHPQHSGACSACEICHSAMLDVPATLIPSHRPPGPLRALTAAQFDSAPAALAIKPPIA